MAACGDQVGAYVLFFTPREGGSDWRNSGSWRSAEEIPGVRVLADEDGRERARFGVETSGHVLLYVAGKLAFSGGITRSRGHSGDNAGRQAIVDLLRQGSAAIPGSSVFGCPLCNQGPIE
jgi:hypothetical protein